MEMLHAQGCARGASDTHLNYTMFIFLISHSQAASKKDEIMQNQSHAACPLKNLHEHQAVVEKDGECKNISSFLSSKAFLFKLLNDFSKNICLTFHLISINKGVNVNFRDLGKSCIVCLYVSSSGGAGSPPSH